MSDVGFDLITPQAQWKIFDATARRLLGISGTEFAERWDRGELLDDDGPWIQQTAILRPYNL